MPRKPEELSTEQLLEIVGHYTERYAAGRHKGQMFRNYAVHVSELLARLEAESQGMHLEYAPVLPSGMVLDTMAVAEPDTLDGRLQTATRLVSPWRTP